MTDRTKEWIVTFGGSGKAPVAPGTAGSFAASVVILVVCFILQSSGWLSPPALSVLLGAGLLLASAIAVILGPWAGRFYGRKDPGPFVLDEVAGICLTMLFQPVITGWRETIVVACAFVSFRLFDVTKLPPCRALEKPPEGWGILLDDLMAAVYANLLAQVVTRGLLRW